MKKRKKIPNKVEISDIGIDLSLVPKEIRDKLVYQYIKVLASEDNVLLLAQNLKEFVSMIWDLKIPLNETLLEFIEKRLEQLKDVKKEISEEDYNQLLEFLKKKENKESNKQKNNR